MFVYFFISHERRIQVMNQPGFDGSCHGWFVAENKTSASDPKTISIFVAIFGLFEKITGFYLSTSPL